MDARYLRVKDWARHQHYDPLKRRPPWIKFFQDVLEPGSKFQLALTEQEAWQLVRIWLVASCSSVLTLDEKSRVVPVVPYDEQSLRRSTMSLKKLPLEKFVRDGWLIVVAEDELWISAEGASAVASTGASAAGSGVDSASLRSRGLEKLEKFPKAVTSFEPTASGLDIQEITPNFREVA